MAARAVGSYFVAQTLVAADLSCSIVECLAWGWRAQGNGRTLQLALPAT
jgi:hypothetical protein